MPGESARLEIILTDPVGTAEKQAPTPPLSPAAAAPQSVARGLLFPTGQQPASVTPQALAPTAQQPQQSAAKSVADDLLGAVHRSLQQRPLPRGDVATSQPLRETAPQTPRPLVEELLTTVRALQQQRLVPTGDVGSIQPGRVPTPAATPSPFLTPAAARPATAAPASTVLTPAARPATAATLPAPVPIMATQTVQNTSSISSAISQGFQGVSKFLTGGKTPVPDSSGVSREIHHHDGGTRSPFLSGLAQSAAGVAQNALGPATSMTGFADTLRHSADAAGSVLKELGSAGGMAAKGLGVAGLAVTAFAGIVEGLTGRAKQLGAYSGEIAAAGAQSEIRTLMRDMAEAQKLGGKYAELLEKKDDAADAFAEAMLPMKEALLDLSNAVMPILTDLMKGLGAVIAVVKEILDAIFQVFGAEPIESSIASGAAQGIRRRSEEFLKEQLDGLGIQKLAPQDYKVPEAPKGRQAGAPIFPGL